MTRALDELMLERFSEYVARVQEERQDRLREMDLLRLDRDQAVATVAKLRVELKLRPTEISNNEVSPPPRNLEVELELAWAAVAKANSEKDTALRALAEERDELELKRAALRNIQAQRNDLSASNWTLVVAARAVVVAWQDVCRYADSEVTAKTHELALDRLEKTLKGEP